MRAVTVTRFGDTEARLLSWIQMMLTVTRLWLVKVVACYLLFMTRDLSPLDYFDPTVFDLGRNACAARHDIGAHAS